MKCNGKYITGRGKNKKLVNCPKKDKCGNYKLMGKERKESKDFPNCFKLWNWYHEAT